MKFALTIEVPIVQLFLEKFIKSKY